MKATIALEYIGESSDSRLALWTGILNELKDSLGRAVIGNPRPRKPWVAELTGINEKFGYERTFLPANWDRRHANGTHSRGVELWFILESGHIYQVHVPTSWRNTARYFCTVSDAGEVVRINESLVQQWLKNR